MIFFFVEKKHVMVSSQNFFSGILILLFSKEECQTEKLRSNETLNKYTNPLTNILYNESN